MRILITGAAGMLGHDLIDALKPYDLSGVGLGEGSGLGIPYETADLSEQALVDQCWDRIRPELVFHLAAFTNVDLCETERDLASLANTKAVECVARASKRHQAPVVFFSTDFIFDGFQEREYVESDTPNPLSYYGATKRDAEAALKACGGPYVTFRICWLYGARGRSFPASILAQAEKGAPLKVVADQVGRPTYTRDVCNALSRLLSADEKIFHRVAGETFHLANDGTASWADFADETLRLAGYSVKVERITAAQLNRPAKRPAHAVLSLVKTQKILGLRLRPWQAALADFIRERQNSK